MNHYALFLILENLTFPLFMAIFVRNYENCNYYAFVCKLVELVKIHPVAYKNKKRVVRGALRRKEHFKQIIPNRKTYEYLELFAYCINNQLLTFFIDVYTDAAG